MIDPPIPLDNLDCSSCRDMIDLLTYLQDDHYLLKLLIIDLRTAADDRPADPSLEEVIDDWRYHTGAMQAIAAAERKELPT